MKYDSRGFFYSPLIWSSDVFACFGTKKTGDALNPHTGEMLLKSMGIEAERIVRPIQTHSATVVDVDGFVGDQPDASDGLIAATRGTALTIVTADCVPLILLDTRSSQIGISHQGWRGLYGKMPSVIAGAMTGGGGADSIHAAIGPAIGACCYTISRELYQQFATSFPRFASSILYIRNQEYYLSLNTLCYLQLREAGVPAGNIDFFPFCTKCNDLFYSYRRDGEHTKSRQLSIIISK